MPFASILLFPSIDFILTLQGKIEKVGNKRTRGNISCTLKIIYLFSFLVKIFINYYFCKEIVRGCFKKIKIVMHYSTSIGSTTASTITGISNSQNNQQQQQQLYSIQQSSSSSSSFNNNNKLTKSVSGNFDSIITSPPISQSTSAFVPLQLHLVTERQTVLFYKNSQIFALRLLSFVVLDPLDELPNLKIFKILLTFTFFDFILIFIYSFNYFQKNCLNLFKKKKIIFSIKKGNFPSSRGPNRSARSRSIKSGGRGAKVRCHEKKKWNEQNSIGGGGGGAGGIMMPLKLENLTIQSKFTQKLRASARLEDNNDIIKMKQSQLI
ncbi:hypothetical protein Mgra_00003821 [Meloidogyne graminicola]|uniref:Uncharacterized protein n=1 Tax=Meloidogyne graminicola TaxID=189291 RepID=A0A8S9ZU52_9BILA|nr:hypothetical protein Mgra_00003821 [Meloidogyne graminicola]